MFDIMSIITRDRLQSTILGDMNVNLLKFGTNPKTENNLDRLFACGFLPIIVKPTRITNSTATLLDHIYTNSVTATGHSGIIITDVADHFGTFYLVMSNKMNNQSRNKIKKRTFSDINIETFRNKLNQTDFTNLCQIICPNEAYNEFMNLYVDAFNTSFPIIT